MKCSYELVKMCLNGCKIRDKPRREEEPNETGIEISGRLEHKMRAESRCVMI